MYYREKAAIFIACELGYIDIVKLLVEYGADVNYCHPVQGSLLQVALLHQHLSLVELLLSYDVILDSFDVAESTSSSSSCSLGTISPFIHHSTFNSWIVQASTYRQAYSSCSKAISSSTASLRDSGLVMARWLLRHGANPQVLDRVSIEEILLCSCSICVVISPVTLY